MVLKSVHSQYKTCLVKGLVLKRKHQKTQKKCTLGHGTSLTLKKLQKPKNINVLVRVRPKKVKNMDRQKVIHLFSFLMTQTNSSLLNIRQNRTCTRMCYCQQKSYFSFLSLFKFYAIFSLLTSISLI